MTNISLALYPSVEQFIKLNPPATTVSSASKYLTTSQILNICNDILYNENLTEEALFNFLKSCNYEMVDIGNNTPCWCIQATNNGN